MTRLLFNTTCASVVAQQIIPDSTAVNSVGTVLFQEEKEPITGPSDFIYPKPGQNGHASA